MTRKRVSLFVVCGLLVLHTTPAPQTFDLPRLLPPAQYGNLLMNRLSEEAGVRPVGFSHWSHRQRHTCRVCHFELDFIMETDATEITEEANRKGRFCGACHDGKTAFDHGEENCDRCHSGKRTGDRRRFKELRTLPESPFGNQIDWVQAMRDGLIEPSASVLEEQYEPIPFGKMLSLQAEWALISPAVFPHDAHQEWLDCANCHPDIFNVKKKTTKHFEMRYILDGKFCGVCHLSVAFPLDDCRRCHPQMKD